MATPVAIEPIVQKTDTDCAIAALAMIFGLPYAEIRNIAVSFWGEALVDRMGLTVKDLQRIARKLTRPLTAVSLKDLDLGGETGLLFLRLKRSYHVVVLFQGVVFNPADGLIWDLDAYKATRNAVPTRLLRA